MFTLPYNHTLQQISERACQPEAEALHYLHQHVGIVEAKRPAIERRAAQLITLLRKKGSGSGVEAFMNNYSLDTREGIAVMCLAEALLRIPDSDTADKLIEDTFSESEWEKHLGGSDSLFVNASTWGLLLTGKVINIDKAQEQTKVGKLVRNLVKSAGEPVIREALKKAMDLMGDQFVLGETIEEAIKRAKPTEKKGYTTSYDMLGEGARTTVQAEQYFQSYTHAIAQIGNASHETDIMKRPGISVKLSALDPRYHLQHRERAYSHVMPKLKALIRDAQACNIGVTLDSEETARLDLQLELFAALMRDPEFADYEGLGFVCQAYQKRAIYIIHWLADLAKETNKRIPVRLVKGAYWDSEIKWAQLLGLDDYPVFTRKEYTDVSYLACAAEMLKKPHAFYPQFATHNALTVSSIIEMAEDTPFEFQRLYGMGQCLYEQIIGDHPCRVYAPVGGHTELLAYLIRRLLENGANTSFVNLLRDRDQSLEMLLEDPVAKSRKWLPDHVSDIPLPGAIYLPDRVNSQGIDIGHRAHAHHIAKLLDAPIAITTPKDTPATAIDGIYAKSQNAFMQWQYTSVQERAAILEKAADMLEEKRDWFVRFCAEEAKKITADGIAEVREAVDFLRYYAARGRALFAPKILQGPTGESNELHAHGRGTFVCISPWNFPLAIFTGQVAAALVTGNTVLAKPAEQTPAIANAMVGILHQAGVPTDVLQLVCGAGETVGDALVRHKDCAGVCFTGSTAVAKIIQRSLAEKDGPIVPFIAETGGQNAMMVESSALLEHATDDILLSAFGSAGQRCSALRVLYVQEDIADPLIDMLKGAMDVLTIGPATDLSTDVGPVIDDAAQAGLLAHIARMKKQAKQWYAPEISPDITESDSFVVPHLFEIAHINDIGPEQFGPILHVIRYDDTKLDSVIDEINSTGYGLTFGLHSRIVQTQDAIISRIKAGNCYINRNMIGATVGVQPFGGEGLSGTGPKAGGPHYLLRFIAERTVTVNTTAIGGNLDLLRKNLLTLDS
jgi:RHH-type proline utilization regulon transcriptional repressor/proline dehydrogenase/delta 1-pyrroline-5-carboxylate dehydrogenase